MQTPSAGGDNNMYLLLYPTENNPTGKRRKDAHVGACTKNALKVESSYFCN
jgi:hypothetical protein